MVTMKANVAGSSKYLSTFTFHIASLLALASSLLMMECRTLVEVNTP